VLRAHHVRNEGPLIGEQYVEAAVRLWREYFWPHSRAALRQIGLTEKHTKAHRVLCWIRTNRKAEVSLLDVRARALLHNSGLHRHVAPVQGRSLSATFVFGGVHDRQEISYP
jgi:hypothetical protein